MIADALARIGKVGLDQPVPVTGSPEDGYRMRARFHVRGRTLGYFREGTHGMCDPMTTRQLLPETGELLGELGERVRAGRLEGVTEIELGENVPATERALHLELDRPHVPSGLARGGRASRPSWAPAPHSAAPAAAGTGAQSGEP